MAKAQLPDMRSRQNAIESPHVVILGAGASVAACPKGDKNGRRLPVMRNLVEEVGLGDLRAEAHIEQSGANFEELYSSIASSPSLDPLRRRMDARVSEYFAALEIPDRVTIYDELILTLRKKDLIATFNWDPLLVQAFRRHAHLPGLPRLAFLHGNVAIGICQQHREIGYIGESCPICGRLYAQTPLLFPIAQKRYREDPFIANEWRLLESTLQRAFIVTIFGYSAPRSDVEARRIMQMAWNRNASKDLCQIEIVDIRTAKEIKDSWREFIVRDHSAAFNRASRLWQYRFPRRSCDSLGAAILLLRPWSARPLPRFRKVESIQRWCEPLIAEEIEYYHGGSLSVWRQAESRGAT